MSITGLNLAIIYPAGNAWLAGVGPVLHGIAYLSSGTLILLTKSSAFHSYAMQTCDVNHGTCMNEYLGSGCTDDDPTTHCEVLQGGDANRP